MTQTLLIKQTVRAEETEDSFKVLNADELQGDMHGGKLVQMSRVRRDSYGYTKEEAEKKFSEFYKNANIVWE